MLIKQFIIQKFLTKVSQFHRVMTIVYKPDPLLQIGDLRKSHSTYPEIQALWLVEKSQQTSISDMGCLGRMTLKMFELIFQKMLLQISISVCQSVPKL